MTALTVVAIAQALALVAVVGGVLLYLDRRDQRTAAERRELLNRVQRPDLIPVVAPPPTRTAPAEVEPDESDQVGRVLS